MTDSGQPAGTPPNSQAPGIPPWAPTPQETAPDNYFGPPRNYQTAMTTATAVRYVYQ
jgi:hypothetical protein